MNKSYPTSRLYKIFSLGLHSTALRIDDDDKLRFGLFKRANIHEIRKISYEVIPAGYSWSYVYRFALQGKKHIDMTYSSMEGSTWEEFLNDIQTVNPRIAIEEGTKKNLRKSKEKHVMKFDFKPPAKGTRFLNDALFAQRHPSLDAAIGFSIVGAYIILPALLYILGSSAFTGLYGSGYPVYRNFMAVLAGFSLATVVMNLIASLASQYLGHKVTIIAGALTVTFLLIAAV